MIKIISWNTNGLRATAKQGFFAPLFKKYKPDILCLQETKVEPDQLPTDVRNIKGYESYFSYSKLRKGYSGVGVYIKSELKPKEIFYGMGIKKFDDEGRIVGAKFKDYTIICGYYPNGGSGPHRLEYKLEFYDAFLKFILKLRKNGENVIFCGDINTAHEAVDLARPKANEENTGFLPIERAWITKVIKNKFIDIYRHLNPNKKDMYTYWDQKTGARSRNVGWRIDYFFVDEKFLPKTSSTSSWQVKNTGMMSDYMGSDHCPIFLDLK